MTKHLMILACLVGSLKAQVASVYVDFGNSQLKTAGVDSFGHAWNNVTEGQSTGLGDLVSDDGASTGFSLALAGTVAFNPYGVMEPGGTSVPDAAALGSLAVSTATRDWLTVSGTQTLTLTFGNLPVDGIYRLSLFGSRDSDQKRVTEYAVTGLTSATQLLQTSGTGIGSSPQANANRSGLCVFENLLPSAQRTLVVTVKRKEGDAGYLGALRLELMNPANFPPAALMVQAAGSARAGSPQIARYTYKDRELDPEGTSTYVWQRASSLVATPEQLAGPETATATYVPTAADVGNYIRVGVTPKAQTGCPEGATVYSKWVGPVVGAATFTSFHIGSSYTQWANMPLQFRNLAQSKGIPVVTGWQVTSGQNSRYHWENGLSGTIGAGTYSRNELASGSWDAVVMQPYNTEWQPAQINQATDYARRFYQLADSNGAQFYLYAAWPSRSQSLSLQTSINGAFETLRSSISVGGNKPALIIPAGEAFRAVIQEASNGYLKSFNTNHSLDRDALYLDDLHQTNLGAYVSALTHYATIMKRSPVGLPASAVDAYFLNDNPVTFSTTLATRIQEIVWWVVANYPNSGVSATVARPVELAAQPSDADSPPPVYVTHAGAVMDPSLLLQAFGATPDGGAPLPGNLPRALQPPPAGQIGVEYVIDPNAEAQQITFTPEWSSDLVQWTRTAPASAVVTRTNQTVRITWPSTSRWRFVRIYVSKP